MRATCVLRMGCSSCLLAKHRGRGIIRLSARVPVAHCFALGHTVFVISVPNWHNTKIVCFFLKN